MVKKTLLTLSGTTLFSLLTFTKTPLTYVPVGKSGNNLLTYNLSKWGIFIIVNMSKSGEGDYPPSDAPLTF